MWLEDLVFIPCDKDRYDENHGDSNHGKYIFDKITESENSRFWLVDR